LLWRGRAGLGIADRGVVLAGHSAGAHLAAMLLATDWAASGDDPAMIAGALLISGVYDLEPIRLSYVNDAIGMDAVDARRNSPLHLVPRVDVPVVISAAERDTDEFRRQARAFAGAWAQHLGDLVLFTHADRNHFDCLFDWHDPTSRLSRETARLAGL
jgi:arylformamidase